MSADDTTTSDPAQPFSTTTQQQSSEDKKSGAIVGGIVGGAGGCAAVALALFVLSRQRSVNQQRQAQQQGADADQAAVTPTSRSQSYRVSSNLGDADEDIEGGQESQGPDGAGAVLGAPAFTSTTPQQAPASPSRGKPTTILSPFAGLSLMQAPPLPSSSPKSPSSAPRSASSGATSAGPLIPARTHGRTSSLGAPLVTTIPEAGPLVLEEDDQMVSGMMDSTNYGSQPASNILDVQGVDDPDEDDERATAGNIRISLPGDSSRWVRHGMVN